MTGVLPQGTDTDRKRIMLRHKQKTNIYKPTGEILEGINPADTLISDFWPPEM